ncbi:MAG: phosphopantothenoylcysteine decarboxylase, partial [Vampirovibrionales bacterium]
ASANMMAKCRHGLTDDLLSCTYITFTGKPVVWVPAMNTRMWEHPATQENWRALQERPQHSGLEPEAGFLACRETGKGHLPLLDHVMLALYKACHPSPHAWQGKRVVVSAGGTQEPLDVARVLTNRSSGKMGIALADEAWSQGAEVVLCAALEASRLPSRPYCVLHTPTVSTLQAALQHILFDMPEAPPTCLWMAAAVSDFKPLTPSIQQKLKKETLFQEGEMSQEATLYLALTLNPDILAGLATLRQQYHLPSKKCYMVGFAAEVHEDMTLANAKRLRKGVEALVLNRVDSEHTGFQSDTNAVTLLQASSQDASSLRVTPFPLQSKQTLAQALLAHVRPVFEDEDVSIQTPVSQQELGESL